MEDKVDKVDIFHPLAQLSWKECSPLPNGIQNADVVTLGDQVFVSGGRYLSCSKHNARLYVSTTSFKSWRVVSTPSTSYSLATYKSQLVLIGGKELATNEVTNKVWVSEDGRSWHTSLPPMTTARHSSSAISSAECLIVSGGTGSNKTTEVDNVEIFAHDQWILVPHLPVQISYIKSTIHNNYLYIVGRHKHARIAFRCKLEALLNACSNTKAKSKRTSQGSGPKWTKFDIDNSGLDSLISFDQHLISVGGRSDLKLSFSSKVQAFSEHTHTWSHIGNAPEELCNSAVTTLPTGELAVIGGLYILGTGDSNFFYKLHTRLSNRVFRGSFCGVSPFDPDAKFTIAALCRLEDAGQNIAKPLMDNSNQLFRALGAQHEAKQLVTKYKKKHGSLEFLHDIGKRFISKEHELAPTWKTFLEILTNLKLGDLSQKIENYLYGGFKYMEAYQHIIANQECLEITFAKIIFLGLPDLGKTTLRRRLLGEIEDLKSAEEEDKQDSSTGTVDSGHSVFIRDIASTTALLTSSDWSAASSLAEEAQVFLHFIYQQIQSGSFEQTDFHPAGELNDSVRQLSKSLDNVANLSSLHHSQMRKPFSKDLGGSSPIPDRELCPSQHAASCNALNSTRPSNIPEMASLFNCAIGPQFWKSNKHHLKAFLRIEDTGGQPELMDMLPALTIGPGLYLLFCKLTDDIDSHYKVSYRSQSGECTIPIQSTNTVEEMFLSALSSISCMSSYSTRSQCEYNNNTSKFDEIFQNSSKSVAYVIGTHKDLVTEEQIEKFDQELQKTVRSTDFYKKGLVKFHLPDKLVIPVDNMSGGKGEINYLRKLIEEALQKHFKKLSIPAPWFAFSLCLRSNSKRTATLKSCIELGQKLGMSEYETKVALWFLHHHAGFLMHFPSIPQLQDLVISDPQLMYDSVTYLILNAFKFGQMSVAAAERFKTTGQFTLEDLKIAASAASQEDFLPAHQLVIILEHLNIIAAIPGSGDEETTYLMPSVLPNATEEELEANCAACSGHNNIAPLMIHFKCGFVPIGIFSALMANLMSQSSFKGMHLHLITDGIKKNKVQFQFGSDRDTITLISRPKFFEVQVTRDKTAIAAVHKVCPDMLDLVESTLNTVTSRMNTAFLSSYHVAFECPAHPGRHHLCVVDSNEDPPHKMDCLHDQHHPQIMQQRHLMWFGKNTGSSVEKSYIKQVSVPSASTYISTLPVTAYPHLDLELDQDHNGVELDLSEIASHMRKWEEKLSSALGLTHIDVEDIKAIHRDRPELQRQAALRQWRNRCGLAATYRRLLEVFVEAGHSECAEAVCSVIRKKTVAINH